MSPEELRALTPVLAAARAHLELCWRFSKAEFARNRFLQRRWAERQWTPSAGFCRHSSFFLQRLLHASGFGDWRARGGTCLDLATGNHEPHWWLESDGYLLDMTAGQFGHEATALLPVSDGRYRAQDSRCGQRTISTLGSVVEQWEGRGFGWYADRATTSAIHTSFSELARIAARAAAREQRKPAAA